MVEVVRRSQIEDAASVLAGGALAGETLVPHGPAAAMHHTARSLDSGVARSGSFVTLFHAQLDGSGGQAQEAGISGSCR
jgi:hypothetical protein